MAQVAIMGAAGYAGIELVRLVLGHPRMKLCHVTSETDSGRLVSEVYPALAGVQLAFQPHDPEALGDDVDVVFLAVPHTAAMSVVPGLLARGMTVVDASADFRLRDAGTYAQWYGVEHSCPELLDEAVYGLPEIARERLSGAKLVACPGCYPTAALLAAVPALEAGVVSADGIVIDAKSGVSGAGRTPSAGTHFTTVNESVSPYAVGTHRHTPEIEQLLSGVAGTDVRVTFVPHLVPMSRGLLATVRLAAEKGLTAERAHAIYVKRFSAEPFITVHAAGRMPSTAEVRGSNRAHLGVVLDERSGSLVVACAIDNLVKGTSGQALQCANLSLGFDETEGIDALAPAV